MSKPTLVEFPIKVKLSDIPGMLRWLADRYEQQHEEDPEPMTLIVVELHEGNEIDMRCFGECPSDLAIQGILQLALHWSLSRLRDFTTKR